MALEASLTAIDYVVAAMMLLIPMGVGIWYALKDAKSPTKDEYLLGGRRMSVIPVTLSLFTTFQSASAQIGLPAEVFYYGGIYMLAGLGLGISYLVGCYTLIPLLYPLRITSIYEYLKLRYKSEAVRLFCTVIGMLTTLFYMAFVLLAPALALQAGFMSNRNQLAPFFVLHLMQTLPGMAGLYVTVLFCGALSSISSGINALAANTVEDILHRPLHGVKEATVVFITKLIAVAYGVGIIGLTYMVNRLRGPILQLVSMVFSAFGSPIVGIFVMGASVPWANKYGALSGAGVTLVFNLWLGIGRAMWGKRIEPLPSIGTAGCSNWTLLSNTTSRILNETFTDGCTQQINSTTTNNAHCHATTEPLIADVFPLFRISYEWHAMIGTILCIVLGLSVSYLTNLLLVDKRDSDIREEESTEARYIFPFLRKFWRLEDANTPICISPRDRIDNNHKTRENVGLTCLPEGTKV
ncbi:sodium-coupled monocarboxylate transporter 1 [Elysia marginata]|uniref:Sodium-coupled monocarboxylate transporter 1 n=1 Tax=Elysia marginata TaxID=1093978 RepID=A0AAV4GP04_9GAST|nr:sodium-coupled monocarboxylate transporter 1 [Elysia marginata]